MRTALTTLTALTAAATLTACASTAKPGGTVTPKTSISKGVATKDATADITLGKVTKDAADITHLAVTVTNHSTKRSDYIVDVAAEDKTHATQYDTGTGFAQNVEPGQKTILDVTFFKPVPAGFAPVVKSVQRTASP